MRERVDARKTRLGPSDLGDIVKGATLVLVSNGRSVARYDLREKDQRKRDRDRGDMLARMVGPTGNLRAPTLRRNGLVVVGYHADAMNELAR